MPGSGDHFHATETEARRHAHDRDVRTPHRTRQSNAEPGRARVADALDAIHGTADMLDGDVRCRARPTSPSSPSATTRAPSCRRSSTRSPRDGTAGRDRVIADNASADIDRDTRASPTSRALDVRRDLATTAATVAAINAAVETLALRRIEFVLISNPDVVLAPGASRHLIERCCVRSRRRRGRTAHPERRRNASTPRRARSPRCASGVGHALFADSGRPTRGRARTARETLSPTATATSGWLSGACLLVRRQRVRRDRRVRRAATSCTSRTSISDTGSGRRAGSNSTCPTPS